MNDYRKVAYIAGSYRADTIRGTVENIRKAEWWALDAWKQGYAVICPHMNTALFDGALPDEAWLHGDLTLINRLDPHKEDCLIMVPGWEQSRGASAERNYAMSRGLKVVE